MAELIHAADCPRRLDAHRIRNGWCWSWCPSCGSTTVHRPDQPTIPTERPS